VCRICGGMQNERCSSCRVAVIDSGGVVVILLERTTERSDQAVQTSWMNLG
jgi:hypothetical protein